MRERKIFKDLSASTVQTVITQLFGLIIFYIISKYLPKEEFGEFNWLMALGSTVITLASLGLDLVFVKKIASGEKAMTISGIHFFHTLLVAITLGTVAFFLNNFIHAFKSSHPLFFFIFLNLCLGNIANSFKLCLNGLEEYKKLAILSAISNLFKLLLIVGLFISIHLTIYSLILVYTLTSFIEFIIGFFMLSKTLSLYVKPVFKMEEYKKFILESLPQLGVVLFDSALARIDWILLGIISTVAATAEYSFVYKMFELSKLPVIIIAPILLTRFSKIFKFNESIGEEQTEEIGFFFQIELFLVMLIPIFLTITWSPLIDYITNNKYGSVNEINYFILASCIPMHAIINFLWTIGFVQSQLKVIFFITIVVSLLNVFANIVFIPLYGSLGSSIAFFTCTVIQLLLYFKFINRNEVKINIFNIGLVFFNSLISILIVKIFISNVYVAATAALLMYVFLAYVTKQVDTSRLLKFTQKNK